MIKPPWLLADAGTAYLLHADSRFQGTDRARARFHGRSNGSFASRLQQAALTGSPCETAMIAAAKTGAAIDEFGLAGLCRLRGSNRGFLLHGMEIRLETQTVGFRMKWILLAVLVSAVLLFLWSGFADVPCQDGVWDAFRQTCVPD